MPDFARADRLLELRQAARLSRERAASEIGVSVKTLYAWEHGGAIKWENAQLAAAFYDVDPETLVDRPLARADGQPSQLDRIESQLLAITDLVERLVRQLESGLPPAPADELLHTHEGDQPRTGIERRVRTRRAADAQPGSA